MPSFLSIGRTVSFFCTAALLSDKLPEKFFICRIILLSLFVLAQPAFLASHPQSYHIFSGGLRTSRVLVSLTVLDR